MLFFRFKMSVDKVVPVIIDLGSGVTKAGFASDDAPKCVFPSVIGRPKHQVG